MNRFDGVVGVYYDASHFLLQAEVLHSKCWSKIGAGMRVEPTPNRTVRHSSAVTAMGLTWQFSVFAGQGAVHPGTLGQSARKPDSTATLAGCRTALVLLSAMQGGTALSHVHRNPQPLERALDGALRAIGVYRPGAR